MTRLQNRQFDPKYYKLYYVLTKGKQQNNKMWFCLSSQSTVSINQQGFHTALISRAFLPFSGSASSLLIAQPLVDKHGAINKRWLCHHKDK